MSNTEHRTLKMDRNQNIQGKIFLKHSSIERPNLSLGEGNGTPLQYSCLENPMDRGAWCTAVHGVAQGRTWLGDFTFTFHFCALGKEMATHCSVLAWRIPGTGEPGGLPSMGSHRVGHDWSDLAAAAATCLSHCLMNQVDKNDNVDQGLTDEAVWANSTLFL